MRTWKIFAILTILCLAIPAAAAEKQQPPEGGPPRDFVLPQTQTFTLDNGLAVTLVPYGALPKVSVTLVVRAGNLNEKADEIWLADFTGNLMKEGTKTRTAKQVAEEAAGMGGSIDINTGTDQTTIGGDVLSEFAPAMTALLADVVRNPLFPDSEVPRLKKDMLRTLSIQESQPEVLGLEKFREKLYGDHPFGRILSAPPIIESFTARKVRAFYDANFGAARSHLYIVGRFDQDAVGKAIREAFGDWAAGPAPLILPAEPSHTRTVTFVDRPGSKQSTVYIGLPVIDPSREDFVALQVTNNLLGGIFISRITMNIREDKGYTYSPYSQLSTRYRDAYWVQFASVSNDVTAPAIKEILKEIDRLRKEPPTRKELTDIQNYMAGTFVLQNSSRYGITGILAFQDLHGLPRDYLSTYVKRVLAVTPEKVRETAETYIKPDELTMVVLGEKKEIKGSLTQFGAVGE